MLTLIQTVIRHPVGAVYGSEVTLHDVGGLMKNAAALDRIDPSIRYDTILEDDGNIEADGYLLLAQISTLFLQLLLKVPRHHRHSPFTFWRQ